MNVSKARETCFHHYITSPSSRLFYDPRDILTHCPSHAVLPSKGSERTAGITKRVAPIFAPTTKSRFSARPPPCGRLKPE